MTELSTQDLRVLVAIARKGISACGDGIPPNEAMAAWQAIGRLQAVAAERIAAERAAAPVAEVPQS